MFILDFSFSSGSGKSLAQQITESGKLSSILGAGVAPSEDLTSLSEPGQNNSTDAPSGDGEQTLQALQQQRQQMITKEGQTEQGIQQAESDKASADSKASTAQSDSSKASQSALNESSQASSKNAEASSKRGTAAGYDAQAAALEKSPYPADRAKAASLRQQAQQLRIEAQELENQARQHLAKAQQDQAEAQQKSAEAQSEQTNKSQSEGQKSNFEQNVNEIKSNLSQVDTKISEAENNLREIEQQKKNENVNSADKTDAGDDSKSLDSKTSVPPTPNVGAITDPKQRAVVEKLISELKKSSGVGSGKPPTPEEMQEIADEINKVADETEGKAEGENVGEEEGKEFFIEIIPEVSAGPEPANNKSSTFESVKALADSPPQNKSPEEKLGPGSKEASSFLEKAVDLKNRAQKVTNRDDKAELREKAQKFAEDANSTVEKLNDFKKYIMSPDFKDWDNLPDGLKDIKDKYVKAGLASNDKNLSPDEMINLIALNDDIKKSKEVARLTERVSDNKGFFVQVNPGAFAGGRADRAGKKADGAFAPGGANEKDEAGKVAPAKGKEGAEKADQPQQPGGGQKAPPIGNAMGFLMAARALLGAIARLTAVASLNPNPIVQIAKNLTNKGLSEQAVAYLEAALVDSAIQGSPVNQQIILTKAQANTIHGEAETNIGFWKEVINQNKQLGKDTHDLAKPA